MTEPTATPARRPSRLGLYLPFSIFTVIVIAWTGFWFYARHRAEQALDLWLSLERAAGRVWTCDDRRIDGYPFRMEIACARPTFTGPIRDRSGQLRQVSGTLGGFSAEALVYNPNRLIATLQSPLHVTDGNGDGADISWTSLRASVEGKPGALGLFSLVAEEPTTTLEGASEPVMRARHFELHLRQAPDTPVGTYDLATTLEGAIIPLLDGVSGNPEPADIELQARADKLDRLDETNPPATLEAWRRAGGRVQLAILRLRKGPVSLEAKGDVTLDEQHFPQGRLNTSIIGADQLLARFGLGGRGGQLGGVLGAILGGRTDPSGEQKGLRMTLRMEGGRASLGPFAWRLQPLY